MSQSQPTRLSYGRYLHHSWSEAGWQEFIKAGIDEGNYQNEVLRDRLLKSIAFVYWKALTEFAERDRLVSKRDASELIDQAIGRFLGVHASTSGRWVKGETLPTADKLFGAVVLVLRKELGEISFPPNREVAWRAVSRTMSLIREAECGGDRREITREEFACVWLLGRHSNADALLGGKSVAARDAVIDDIANELYRRFRNNQSRRLVNAVAAEWVRPYLFFSLGLLPCWEFLDDDAVTTV